MMILDPVKNFINRMDIKTFYFYMLGYGIACLLLSVLIVVYYYLSIGDLTKKIKNLNVHRETVMEILTEFEKIKQQQAIVEEILAKNPDFKIAGEFKAIVGNLHLTDKEHGKGELSVIDLEDNYRKNELTTKFENMSMQDLTRLLEEIEKNPRIATERLEITGKDHAIDVGLTISTLLPKTETAIQGT